MKKSCKKVWRLKNLLYLCTRNQEGTTLLKATGSGALVQLVRIRACHARGQGFESPTHRTKEDNRKVVFFFCLYLCKVRAMSADYIGYVMLIACYVCKPTAANQHNSSLCDSPRPKIGQ